MRKLILITLTLIPICLYGQDSNKENITMLYNFKINLLETKALINESFHLTQNWVFIDKQVGTPDKIKLLNINEIVFPQLLDSLTTFYNYQDIDQKERIINISLITKQLINSENNIISKLQTFEDYDNPIILFEIEPELEPMGNVALIRDSAISLIDTMLSEINAQIRNNNITVDLKNYKSPKKKDILILVDLLDIEKQIHQVDRNISIENVIKIKESMINSYDKHFNHEEIKDLIIFYKSDTGQKLIKNSFNITVNLLTDLMKKK